MNASRLLVGAVVIIAVGACGGGGSKQAVTPECDQAVIKVAALPGLNATPEQTPDIVNSTRTATLIQRLTSSGSALPSE